MVQSMARDPVSLASRADAEDAGVLRVNFGAAVVTGEEALLCLETPDRGVVSDFTVLDGLSPAPSMVDLAAPGEALDPATFKPDVFRLETWVDDGAKESMEPECFLVPRSSLSQEATTSGTAPSTFFFLPPLLLAALVCSAPFSFSSRSRSRSCSFATAIFRLDKSLFACARSMLATLISCNTPMSSRIAGNFRLLCIENSSSLSASSSSNLWRFSRIAEAAASRAARTMGVLSRRSRTREVSTS
mmetsp:Transcript_14562/g.40456  ORF Transcript_14562/g.40456 Transcript_14562/m.40456 type:complete len:245 (-) Transcript_14562:325-1059(-)